ncbi:MAG: adenine deaminase [Caldisericum sp.]|uniref:adenine deaminase n=1 Tax=Caldisericum sp. TaxID=2499687 RepID=UPI003D12721B
MELDRKKLSNIIDVARRRRAADVLIKNAKIINVFNESIEEGDIAIAEGVIAGVGRYDEGNVVYNVDGAFVSPSFIDSHMHIESTMLIPTEFAKAVVPLGTTTAVVDPHEIANVAGIPGIQFMINASNNVPMDIYFMLSSCVPATNLETSGATLYAEDLAVLKNHKRVLGLAEMMNYPGVINKDPEILDKILLFRDGIIDGHSPTLSGYELNAYLSAGILADHECTTKEEAFEKLSKGMWIMMREGSVTRDVRNLLPVLNDKTKHRFLLCTDDKHPEDLISEGHINFAIKLLFESGIPLPTSIRLATLNPSLFFGFRRKGGIAPGYAADIVVFENLNKMDLVFKDGNLVAKDGVPLFDVEEPKHDDAVKNTINIKVATFEKLKVPLKGKRIRVIGLRHDSIVTDELVFEPRVDNGLLVSDTERDIIKIAVFERHKATGKVSVGFIHGLGLKKGAFATSIAHDSHNIIVAGENDKDMLLSVSQLEAMGGGISIAKDGVVIDYLALPYGGLMTNRSVYEVAEVLKRLHKVAHEELGVSYPDPFMALAFMHLAVIPKLKITDSGLVDVEKFSFVDLFVE